MQARDRAGAVPTQQPAMLRARREKVRFAEPGADEEGLVIQLTMLQQQGQPSPTLCPSDEQTGGLSLGISCTARRKTSALPRASGSGILGGILGKEKHRTPFQQTPDANLSASVSRRSCFHVVQWHTPHASLLCCRLLEQRLSIVLAETGSVFIREGFLLFWTEVAFGTECARTQ